tara:strand:- start:219 stop:950 length:732 start_codon:yes stop_codon:yes gene_type:complete
MADSPKKEIAFVTLSTKTGSLEWPAIMRAFSRFIQWYRRHHEPRIQYVAIKETGKRGMRHLHVILTRFRYVHQSRLSAVWSAFTAGSWGVDVRRLRRHPELAGAYVSKYVAKNVHTSDLRKVVTYSKGWPRLPKKYDWTPLAVENYVEALADSLTQTGLVGLPGAVVNSTPCGCFGTPIAIDRGLIRLWLASTVSGPSPPWKQALEASLRRKATAAAVKADSEARRARPCRSESIQLGFAGLL